MVWKETEKRSGFFNLDLKKARGRLLKRKRKARWSMDCKKERKIKFELSKSSRSRGNLRQ